MIASAAQTAVVRACSGAYYRKGEMSKHFWLQGDDHQS
jgi:hypothetical protein